jgi:L-aminopeptidase/D-esterase-like protein
VGSGATVGKLFGIERAMKGGIGSASIRIGAITVAALVAVNALGDVIDPQSRRIVAGARGDDGLPFGQTRSILRGELPQRLAAGMATTIGVIATDAKLSKAQATRLAAAGHDGLARVIDPIHTPADGDCLFALATGGSGLGGDLTVLCVAAAAVVAAAVLAAVRQASGLPGLPSASELAAA